MTKKILGLDLGTNSIGWAVVNKNEQDSFPSGIEMAGSRIIPMSEDILGDFDKGNSVSQTAARTGFRSTRRLRERCLLRRSRLHRVLDFMGFLPEHYAKSIDKYGNFQKNTEPKLAWKEDDGIHTFLFMDSFNEMLSDFKINHPELCTNGKRIPLDWTIYFLRKKALTKKISKEELAWILLNFNQKRGYYQLRGEDDDAPVGKKIEYKALKVISVEATNEKKGQDVWYNVLLENGWIYRRTSKYPLDWVGKVKEFVVTTDLDENGNEKLDKEGQVKRSFRAPSADDWTLLKAKTENEIVRADKTVGEYIYDSLLSNPKQKIIGKLVRTIERKFYKQELIQILEKQAEFHAELQNIQLYKECLELLYEHNDAHRNNVKCKSFTYLFVDDIIFYQRPLKSKKSLIADCPYEEYKFRKPGTEEWQIQPIKCIPKSHPLFQEFRLWQFIQNLRFYQNEKYVKTESLQLSLFSPSDGANTKLETNVDVTQEFLQDEAAYVRLFEWLNDRKEVEQKDVLKYFGLKKDISNFRWNYVEDKKYPCNETRSQILTRLKKSGVPSDFLTESVELQLWHILYSVEDKIEIEKAISSFANEYGLPNEFLEQFIKFPPFKKEYGSYSAKAIKKLLPLMRMGKYWNENAIDRNTRGRIDKIINGEYDDKIRDRVREKAINLTDISQFAGLPVWLACYIVYDRHSEVKDVVKWENPEDIDAYLKSFKQHSLRNPIVEQIVLETLRTVRDIWKSVGNIDEIHLEMGREMKNPADKRRQMTERSIENENTNLRIKALLMEFKNPDYHIDDVRPYSPMQQDILRIYEEYALANLSKDDANYDFVSKIARMAQPSQSEIQRYKLWLEQQYRSPYTGRIIPLAKLFTSAYQIEHVIPQARYFDDSFSNKVICESEINQLKSSMLGYEFISKHHGELVPTSMGEPVRVFSVEEYEAFVKEHYASNKTKMKKLLMDDIPDGFIERQLNDSRYISKFIKGLLSNIVRGKDEEEAIAKNLITCTGGVTDRLKKDWGVNDVWNRIILPRFQRLNALTDSHDYTSVNTSGHEIPVVPLDKQKGFNKKRIDHRHHAMDAIVIACATREHVNLLNNEAAMSKDNANRYQLSRKLRRYETVNFENGQRDFAREFILPWNTFPQDVYAILNNMVVSFKQNTRIINNTVNRYWSYSDAQGNSHIGADGKPKKIQVTQVSKDHWAIRKPMHKDTVFAEVNLRMTKEVNLASALKQIDRIVNKDFKLKVKELVQAGYDAKKIKKYLEDNADVWQDVNPAKISVYYYTKETNDHYFATRKALDTSFDRKKIEESITDTGIRKILLRHLELNENNPELAFSPDGIDAMNKNIVSLNDGKYHQPILKVRWFEKGEKFAVGQTGNKSSKFVEAAKGTNLFFAVYADQEGKRSYETIPLNVVIDRLKNRLLPVSETSVDGAKLLFSLSPGDLVYVLEENSVQKNQLPDKIDLNRIYKMVSSSGAQCFYTPLCVSKAVVNKFEFSPLNKMERAITPGQEMIKAVCVPIKVNRLGQIQFVDN